MGVPLFLSFLVLLGLGVPIAFAFGASGGLFLKLFTSFDPKTIAPVSFAAVDSFPLMAVPFFIFAGDLMRAGGTSRRIVDFANAITGSARGAVGAITVLACAFFGAISGSSAATVAAIGAIMIPEMVRSGYRKDYAVSLSSASGFIGILIPPSIPMVIYGVTASVSIGKLFLAGVVPGILVTLAFIAINNLTLRKLQTQEADGGAHRLKKVLGTGGRAAAGLMMPVIVLGGIYLGIFTPTEAAAVAVVYGLFVGIWVYKELKLKDIPQIAAQSALTSAAVLLIIAFASFFGRIMTTFQIPTQIADYLLTFISSKFEFILVINILLLFLGMFVETSTSILMVTPILLPIALRLGIDPVHFGTIMVLNLAIGLITPPMALNLFIGSQISGLPISKIARPVVPFLFASLAILVIVSFVPSISLFLPNLLVK